MKKNEIITKLTNDINRHAYRATIQEHLKNLGYDASMMDWESAVDFGKAFEAMEILNMITGSTKGDDEYGDAVADAQADIKVADELYGYSKKYFIDLLNKSGYDGKAHYELRAKWDDSLPQ